MTTKIKNDKKHPLRGYFLFFTGAGKEDSVVERENSQQNFPFKTNDSKQFFGHMDGIMESWMDG